MATQSIIRDIIPLAGLALAGFFLIKTASDAFGTVGGVGKTIVSDASEAIKAGAGEIYTDIVGTPTVNLTTGEVTKDASGGIIGGFFERKRFTIDLPETKGTDQYTAIYPGPSPLKPNIIEGPIKSIPTGTKGNFNWKNPFGGSGVTMLPTGPIVPVSTIHSSMGEAKVGSYAHGGVYVTGNKKSSMDLSHLDEGKLCMKWGSGGKCREYF